MIKTAPTAKAVTLLCCSTASDRPVTPRRQVCLFGDILRKSLHRCRLTPERRDKGTQPNFSHIASLYNKSLRAAAVDFGKLLAVRPTREATAAAN